ncbi:MAG: hypothetical protein HS103_02025 [Anaerolineales bacterium]|nr:hypothetical protein [Anaerolineales bacterium]
MTPTPPQPSPAVCHVLILPNFGTPTPTGTLTGTPPPDLRRVYHTPEEAATETGAGLFTVPAGFVLGLYQRANQYPAVAFTQIVHEGTLYSGWFNNAYGTQVTSGDCGSLPLPTATPMPTVTPIQADLSAYGITLQGAWSPEEIAAIHRAVTETARALHSLSQHRLTQTEAQVFQTVMGSLTLVKGGTALGICFTDNNTASISCALPLIAPDNVTYLPFTEYVIVHEFGHVFDSRASLGGRPRFVDRMSSGTVISDCTPNEPKRVMGEYSIGNVLERSWLRGERGWGSGPARIGLATVRQVTQFQQNAVLIEFQIDPTTVDHQFLVREGIPPPTNNTDTSGAKLKRVEEAQADMFLNWVYRRNVQGISQNERAVCDQATSPLWNGPGFLNQSWLNGIQQPVLQPAERPGDIRYQWMDAQMKGVFHDQQW